MKGTSIQILMSLILLFVGFDASGQSISEHSRMMISRNIMSYHYRFAMNYDLNLSSDGVLQNDDFFFEELWPTDEKPLDFDIVESELAYPEKGYAVYQIHKKGYGIGNDSVRIFTHLSSLKFDDDYLIALNKEEGKIKFISGNFFKSKIADDFDIDVSNIDSIVSYLRWRLYHTKPESIIYDGKKNGYLCFKVGIEGAKKKLVVDISETDFDDIKIRGL